MKCENVYTSLSMYVYICSWIINVTVFSHYTTILRTWLKTWCIFLWWLLGCRENMSFAIQHSPHDGANLFIRNNNLTLSLAIDNLTNLFLFCIIVLLLLVIVRISKLNYGIKKKIWKTIDLAGQPQNFLPLLSSER